jgi:hypothetical protein
MGHGTMSKGFPFIHDVKGKKHPANKHVDHEDKTEHAGLVHLHGPHQKSGFQPASVGLDTDNDGM